MKFIRKSHLFFVISVLIAASFEVSAQENETFETLLGKLAIYSNVHAPEKVYVQTDKDLYTNGETIWFKTYLLNGITHTESDKSNVVYVELLDADQNIVAQRKLFKNEYGASGDIAIPDEIDEGSYVLRAYTKYMLNDDDPPYFEKRIDIWKQNLNGVDTQQGSFNAIRISDKSKLTEIDAPLTSKTVVQFFPEGGDLIEGFENVLGLKITDAKGKGVSLQGKIVDQNGKLAATFKSYKFGLARTYFDVAPDTEYYAEIEINGNMERYLVPKPMAEGYVLQVLNRQEYIRINVSTNRPEGLEGALLLGHLRGDVILKHYLGKKDENSTTIKLLPSKLSDGVAHFTLFAPDGEPVNERVIFVENPNNDVTLSIDTDKANYDYRDNVDVSLDLSDAKGEPIEGDLSMSVFTENGLGKKPKSIRSWLLLNSDLGGTVEDPNYFFAPSLKGSRYMLDLLMLTHGWRRFAWSSFMKKGVDRAFEFTPEKGMVISGKTTAFENAYQPQRASTTLSILAKDVYQKENVTNAQGKFSFGPYFFQDSLDVVVNAKPITEGEKTKEQLAIYLDPTFPKIEVENSIKRTIEKDAVGYAEPYLAKAQLKKQTDFKYDPKVTQLKEVVVKSRQKIIKERINDELNTRTLYGQAQIRLFPDSLPWIQNSAGGILDILRLVPGVRVVGVRPNLRVIIRDGGGAASPLFLLDGIPTTIDFIQYLPVSDVLFVDVLKGPDGAIYGSRANGGVVALHTKRGDNFDFAPKRTPGVVNAKIPGFYKTREFYSPNYTKNRPEYEKPDYRLTLHWAPRLIVDETGRSKLNFFIGDSAGKYIIRIEGMTYDGRAISALHNFEVQANKGL